MAQQTTGMPMLDLMLTANRIYVDFWSRAFSFPGPHMAFGRPPGRMWHSEQGRQPNEQVIGVGEESLDVSKQRVTTGATRVRRTVKEYPVERRVALQDETIIVERRPANGQSADDDALIEREYVMIDTREIPVVNKAAHLREQLVLRKQTNNRVEVIRENLRRAEVQVEQPQRVPVVVAQTEEHHEQHSETMPHEHHQQHHEPMPVAAVPTDQSKAEGQQPGEEHHETRNEPLDR